MLHPYLYHRTGPAASGKIAFAPKLERAPVPGKGRGPSSIEEPRPGGGPPLACADRAGLVCWKRGIHICAAHSWPGVWKKGTAASSLRMNSRPKDPGPQLLAMAEEAFCR